MFIKENDLVLFQGDSITDCGRDRNNFYGMGNGYANFVSAFFSALYPEMNVKFINRGISGNRVVDLVSRWGEDCIDLKPNVVSVLIGINDTWRRYDRNDITTIGTYEEGYRAIIGRIKGELPNTRLIICEPFVLPHPIDRIAWREDLDPKINVARAIAREFGALYIPFDGIFAAASIKQPPEFWARDGVHPLPSGHALMANEWLKAVGAIK